MNLSADGQVWSSHRLSTSLTHGSHYIFFCCVFCSRCVWFLMLGSWAWWSTATTRSWDQSEQNLWTLTSSGRSSYTKNKRTLRGWFGDTATGLSAYKEETWISQRDITDLLIFLFSLFKKIIEFRYPDQNIYTFYQPKWWNLWGFGWIYFKSSFRACITVYVSVFHMLPTEYMHI